MKNFYITINLDVSPEVPKGSRTLKRQGKQITVFFHDKADVEAFKVEFEARLSARLSSQHQDHRNQ